jgi:hypothetical protein
MGIETGESLNFGRRALVVACMRRALVTQARCYKLYRCFRCGHSGSLSCPNLELIPLRGLVKTTENFMFPGLGPHKRAP